ncbi:DnaJ-domain-containing protein [Sporormia fimetaria CBS 119925]|uniref:DnaJ-domain-containing protein n=1 Tax=Sporormia fimetaria CBS 119925 TaxID=1340428 RepID=A0A6A6V7S4_9PLEO|nr:DnaJ-domain-containing protein [Sporormia fimetaria CBS 119925]
MPHRPALSIGVPAPLRKPHYYHYHLRHHRLPHHPSCPSKQHFFHTSPPLLTPSSKTHYETLDIAPTATSAEIKRQYFTLSKQYHPDRNPSDPNASTRFVEISEAYHVLSVAEKRAQYDAQISASRSARHGYAGSSTGGVPTGSHSSYQSYAGGRPATGLNKKRGTFRGPPPSFYKAGGYGKHGTKRAEYAHHNPHPAGGHEAPKEAGSESYGGFGDGMGPGHSGRGNEVPHFDDRRHKRMHESVSEHIARRRQQKGADVVPPSEGHSFLVNFVMVGGALVAIGFLANVLRLAAEDGAKQKEKQKRESSQ